MGLDQDRALIQGVSFTSQLAPTEPPLITVIGKAKASGKSSLAPTLYDFPNEGDRPLMAAFDRTGPDSCAQLGYAVPNVKIEDLPGDHLWTKTQRFLDNMEAVYCTQGRKPYSTMIVDCGSTQAAKFWRAWGGITDPRQRYGKVLDCCTEFLDRITMLGIPIIYLAWLTEPWIEESGSAKDGNKKRTEHKGGVNIKGGFKDVLAGRSMMIFYLEKIKPAPASKDKDADGFKRVFHTREYGGVECGGRYKLPEPMDANLGMALAMIMGMVENPALAGLELRR